jgi:hypothetical protein
MPPRFRGEVFVLDLAGDLVVRADAILVATEAGSATFPRWEGKALVGLPGWKGVLRAPGVDWVSLADARVDVVLRFASGVEARALLAYAGSAEPDVVDVVGGPPSPFP